MNKSFKSVSIIDQCETPVDDVNARLIKKLHNENINRMNKEFNSPSFAKQREIIRRKRERKDA